MDILISIIIYIVVFALVYFLVIGILKFLDTEPKLIRLASAVMYGIFLILILLMVFGGDPGYLPRYHLDRR